MEEKSEKLGIEERSGVPGSANAWLRKPYSESDMLMMFGPYLTKNDVTGLSPREIRLIETVEHLRAGIEITSSAWDVDPPPLPILSTLLPKKRK